MKPAQDDLKLRPVEGGFFTPVDYTPPTEVTVAELHEILKDLLLPVGGEHDPNNPSE